MIDCLFVLRDIGETKALLPVIERLADQGREVHVLALGQAAKSGVTFLNDKRITFSIPDDIPGVKTRLRGSTC